MLKVIFKIALVIAIAFTLTLGIGTCTKDFIQPANAAETSDWKLCNTKLVMANTLNIKVNYTVLWVDHDLKDLTTEPLPRCGGEIEARGIQQMSNKFRLCPGYHSVVWKLSAGVTKTIIFLVTPDIKQIVLTPENVFKKWDYFYKEPKQEDA